MNKQKKSLLGATTRLSRRRRFASVVGGVLLLVLVAALYLLKAIPEPPKARSARHIVRKAPDYWSRAEEKTYKSFPLLLRQHRAELARGMGYYKLFRGPVGMRQVALTFDDGPHPRYTRQILKILKRYNASATFFVVGELAERHPELVLAEVAQGNSVGNHTYHHVNLTKIPAGYVAAEIEACDEVLFGITHQRSHIFRPPGGDYNIIVSEVAEALRDTVILWTDDPADYASPGEQLILSRIKKRLKDGGIILVHDGIKQTIDILPSLLEYLKARGYETVTVDQMLDESRARGRGLLPRALRIDQPVRDKKTMAVPTK